MNEFFLHYVWQYQVLSRSPLVTTRGESIQVVSPGVHHTQSGPDFQHARLLIQGVEWFGHVEVHWKASDWKAHGHTQDPAYNTVILHLVWEEDLEIRRPDGSPMPTVELVSFVSPALYKHYRDLIRFPDKSRFIACASHEWVIPQDVYSQAIQRALLERINKKVDELHALFDSTNKNWEETAYRWSAQGFGFSLHKESMDTLAERVQYSTMARLRSEPETMEALYFGMSGLLPEQSEDPQIKEWITWFQFFKRKYTWTDRTMEAVYWKFGRTRPTNFPTLRIAQWVAFLRKTHHLHATFLEPTDVHTARKLFELKVHPYWYQRNRFEKEGKHPHVALPLGAVDRLLINILIPYQIFVGRYWDEFDREKRAYQWLFDLPPESNSLLDQWQNHLKIQIPTAGDAQGLIGLYRDFCQPKRCALCPVGHFIFRS
ncbi:MAG: DUF2851 family protein [Spirosomataceae bacterium]